MISVNVRTNTQTLEGMVYVKFWIYSFNWVLRSYVNNIINIFLLLIFFFLNHKKWKSLIDSFRRITRSFLGTYILLHNFFTWFLMNKMHTYLEIDIYNCAHQIFWCAQQLHMRCGDNQKSKGKIHNRTRANTDL